MIEFMVIGAPRSGTTWCANWLTTDTTMCLHGLEQSAHFTTWDAIQSKRRLGVSSHVIWAFPKWVNSHPARKLIVHRPIEDIAKSVSSVVDISKVNFNLDALEGLHIEFDELFNSPRAAYEFLLQLPFDEERHNELKRFQINAMAEKVNINAEEFKKLKKTISEGEYK